MKKLSDYKNEEALDLLADLIEPTAKILGDKEMLAKVRTGSNKMELIKMAIKTHKAEIIEILAIIEGVPVEKYEANIVKITNTLLEIMNDKDLTDFFTSQAQMEAQSASSFATENTEEKEK